MKKFLTLLVFITLSTIAQKLNIGLCMVATGKYIQFVTPLIRSAEKYFCPRHNRTYFVFTDNNIALKEQDESSNIQFIYQKRLGWPYDTLLRFDVYLKNQVSFADMDYIFATDADMLFVNYMGDEILGKHVGTQHPGHNGKNPLWSAPGSISYETNPISTAYISHEEGEHYFAGGFYGGSYDGFFSMLTILMKRINADFVKDYIAVWHDESHLNRFFIDFPPEVILDRSYCYPEHGEVKGYPKCEPKLLALDKDHASIRE